MIIPAGVKLSPTEIKVYNLISVRDDPYKVIAYEIGISHNTIKIHIANLYRKLGVPNRSAFVRYALTQPVPHEDKI